MSRVLMLCLLVSCCVVARAEETPKQQFKARQAALKGSDDPLPYVELGDWCREQEPALKRDARWCYEKAWSLESGRADAREGMNALGYDLYKGKWRTAKVIYAARRKVLRKTPKDADARYALAMFAKQFGMTREMTRELKTTIKIDGHHKPARKALGFTFLYGKWLTDEQVAHERKIDGIWKAGLGAKQTAKEIHASLKDAGWKGKLSEIERVQRLQSSPGGTHKDVRMPETSPFATGEYTYGVPPSYQVWRPNPLIVFLHGGGQGVGDGDHYFPQVWPHSKPRGYITVCPTVLEKVAVAWNNSRHEDYVRALVKVISEKYHVDPSRTYLLGHSMGGFGTFYIGPRTTDVFAAISPWSGGTGRGGALSKLKYTPIYIIHGARDRQVPPTGSRHAAKQLAQMKYEYTYVEMDIDGHGVPAAEKEKALDWLERWTLDPRAKSQAGKTRKR